MPPDLLVPPLGVPGAAYAGALIGLLIVATLVGILSVSLLGAARRPRRDLLAKWLTWAVIAPAWWLAAFTGPATVAILVTTFAVIGVNEFSRLVHLPNGHRLLLVAGALIAGVLSAWGPSAMLAMIPLLLLVGTLQPVVNADVHAGMRHLAFGALGFAYLPVLLDHAVFLRSDGDPGAVLLFTIGIAVAFSDIGAYVVGRTFGRHPLTPTLSPNKTIEGLAGNLLGAALAVALMWPILSSVPAWFLVTLPVVVAVGSVWGDLFESALKREFAVKDAGTWLPGFGGLLDRIDSFVLVTPLVYYSLRAVGAGA